MSNAFDKLKADREKVAHRWHDETAEEENLRSKTNLKTSWTWRLMKDINQFLEGADDKAQSKKSDANKTKEMKAHHAKEMEEVNDKLYIQLMDQYKQTRRHDREGSKKLLEKEKMKNVSTKAKDRLTRKRSGGT